MLTHHSTYCGRFAPSPTGPLHLGSLFIALASYLHAKKHQGRWLVRIEDVDRYRCKPQYTQEILATLEHYGLFWDDNVILQSERYNRYHEVLNKLTKEQKTYPCICTRKQLSQFAQYPGTCRQGLINNNQPTALRFCHDYPVQSFYDHIFGVLSFSSKKSTEDFVLLRRDQCIAYQLAVVVDDIDQQVTHIIRGADLIDSTYWQLALYQQFKKHFSHYWHLPLLCTSAGKKLSKQNYAPALPLDNPQPTLLKVLELLDIYLSPEYQLESVQTILHAALEKFEDFPQYRYFTFPLN